MLKKISLLFLFILFFILLGSRTSYASTTFSSQIIQGSDDGYDIGGSNTFLTGTPVFSGGKDNAGNLITGGFRFLNITIPQGAVIESAKMDWQESWSGNYGTNVKTKIFGEAADTSSAFSNLSLPRNRVRTTASTLYNSANENNSAGTWLSLSSLNRPPDITPIIQEIVNRPGWVSGNALSILVTDNGSTNDWWWEFKSFEAGSTISPKLTITYTSDTVPTPTAISTPTPTVIASPTLTPSTPTPTINTPTPTNTPLPFGAGFSTGRTGYADNIARQLVRTVQDKLYVFAVQAQYSQILKAYWTDTQGIPTSSVDFSGSAQITDSSVLISADSVYDGGSIVHVLVNTQGGVLKDYPFDLATNTFKPAIQLATGNPVVSGDYIGTQGVSGMIDTQGTLHIAYWSAGNHIMYLSYSYDSPTNSLNLLWDPFQIDIAGNATHPELVISPRDGSVTVLFVSRATTPRKILVRTLNQGVWGDIETASSGDVWWSDNAGREIDQGPSTVISSDGTKHMVYMQNFDSTGDYGRMHYVTQVTGSATWIDTTTNFYSHAAGIAINATGELYIIGHGHPNNTSAPISCQSMLNMCYIMKSSGGSFSNPMLLVTHQGTDSLDSSASIKWGVVGWNRPETVETIFFSANNGSYNNTTLYYGSIGTSSIAIPTPTANPTVTPTPTPNTEFTPTPTLTTTPTPTVTSTPTQVPTTTPTPTGTSGTTITRQVSSSTDDVNQDNGTLDLTSSTAWVGTGQSTTVSFTGLRFTNIPIPQNAQIISAHVELYIPQSSWITRSLSISAQAIGNGPTFSTNNKPSQRTLTSAKVAYSSSNQWNGATWVSLPEMKSVIQELVNRIDWATGNSVALIFKGTGSAYGRSFFTSYNGSALLAPRLVITYQ